MAVLDDLPYENLVELLSLLSCTDLASTSRVSRRFHDVSQPLLYKAPKLGKIRENPSAAGLTRLSLEILLRTLLTPGRERLGSHVRSLRLEFDNHRPDPAREYPDDTIAFLTGKAPKLGINNLPRSQGAQLMLLLDLLPRLHDLHITPPNNSRDCFTSFLNPIVAMETLPRGLQSLGDIHYERTVNSCAVQSKRLLLLFKLPSIRSIDVPSNDLYIWSISVSAMVAAAETSNVTRLRFSYAEMSSWALQYILRVPIALSHFSYSPVGDIDFDLPEFMSAMAPLRPSVQYLHLDFSNVEVMTVDEADEFILPYDEGSLRSWSMLRTLSCSLMPLLGKGQRDGSPRLMNVLPAGIRELEILEDWHWSRPEEVDQIVELLAQKDWVVPCLEKLAVVLKLVKCQRATDELTIACEAAGVSFVEDSFVW